MVFNEPCDRWDRSRLARQFEDKRQCPRWSHIQKKLSAIPSHRVTSFSSTSKSIIDHHRLPSSMPTVHHGCRIHSLSLSLSLSLSRFREFQNETFLGIVPAIPTLKRKAKLKRNESNWDLISFVDLFAYGRFSSETLLVSEPVRGYAQRNIPRRGRWIGATEMFGVFSRIFGMRLGRRFGQEDGDIFHLDLNSLRPETAAFLSVSFSIPAFLSSPQRII